MKRERCSRTVSRVFQALVISFVYLAALTFPVVWAGEIQPNVDKFGNVTWGNGPLDPDVRPIKDKVPNLGFIEFYWTDGDAIDPQTGARVPEKHPGYAAARLADDVGGGWNVTFHAPVDPSIKDWRQTVRDGSNHISDVTGGAIQHHSPWAFFPLNELPNKAFAIPDFAGANQIVYAAVDLLTYVSDNPLGPRGGMYRIGDTLDGLGLSIVNGRIAGLNGMYFATTPFGFDPASATGYVPLGGDTAWLNSANYEAANGSLEIIGIHNSVPEPETVRLWLIGLAAVILGRIRNGRSGEAQKRSACIAMPE